MNVQKYPPELWRKNPRMEFPNYDGLEWLANKQKWDKPLDTISIPTGIFKDQPGCNRNPATVAVTVNNKLGDIMPKRRNIAWVFLVLYTFVGTYFAVLKVG